MDPDPDIQFTHWNFNRNFKRKAKPPVTIILDDSDSDIEFIEVRDPKDKNKSKNGPPPSKKMRTMPSQSVSVSENRSRSTQVVKMDIDVDEPEMTKEEIESDYNDSDYDNIPGYEIPREEYPPPTNVLLAGDNTVELQVAIKKLSLSRVQVLSNPGLLRLHQTQTQGEYKGVRGIHKLDPPRASVHGLRWRKGHKQDRGKEFNTPLKHLSPSCSFRMADACTWICQTGERVLVSSGTPGGGENDGERNPYNESNTLAFFKTGFESPEFIPSHHLRGNDPGGDGNPDPKYFDVERACFDPNEPNVFVSSGRDGVLTIWNYMTPKINNLYSNSSETKFSYVPTKRWGRETYNGYFVHDIVFRKNKIDRRSIFSAPCRNGNLFIHSYSYDGEQTVEYAQQKLSNKQVLAQNTQIGATLWGHYASSDELFTCTEVKRTSTANVFHHVYDIQSGKTSYSLDKRQNGEEICLSPDGSMLALFTQRGNILDLNLYDTRRKDGNSVASIKDIPCDDEEPDVTKAAWSPDGILLAVATNDHRIRVYDGRFLNSGTCLMELFHDVQMERSFSITFMEWTTEALIGQNVGLVTGNSGDNRILLWDTRYSNEKPTVLAELCSQVSVGCLGDPYKREKPLIIGGLDGWVYAYDTSGHVF